MSMFLPCFTPCYFWLWVVPLVPLPNRPFVPFYSSSSTGRKYWITLKAQPSIERLHWLGKGRLLTAPLSKYSSFKTVHRRSQKYSSNIFTIDLNHIDRIIKNYSGGACHDETFQNKWLKGCQRYKIGSCYRQCESHRCCHVLSCMCFLFKVHRLILVGRIHTVYHCTNTNIPLLLLKPVPHRWCERKDVSFALFRCSM